ncbi:MAG: DUF262 domain-containing protein [Proteobacteria bacterium]|nr:DUF262 domain-containing protein [Pseudomonadota bacterium]MBU4259763.1 DUF262 domain-containing protein [Pseudomonadota bacterium]MBU4288059.1 DUF262 domain-containing protein [Pseudomonadota bacterium]MBU4415423.1 DUF262 domain-containing protein [Pseudomonadota bacterium]MCG2757184.1 DUF262 domain-containing protein [Desulfobacteraceae bacterium]
MKMEKRSRAIDKVYKRRDQIDMPDFQREDVWSDDKKRLLIDSILKGWHLPKFYFCKMEDNTFECVDGQQRLSAIFSFFSDDLTLSGDTSKRIGASKYTELDDDISDEFDDFEIEIEEIAEASDEELEELFKRLQLGMPLNTAEKINAIQGELRNFCHDVADKPFFADRIGIKDTRYTHFETVAKWVFVEARGIQPQMRYPQLESLLKDNRTFSRSSDTAKRIEGAVNFLSKAFPNDCKVVRNRANALSICMLAARVHAQKLTSDTAATQFRDFVQTFFRQLSAEVQKGVKAVDKELLRYQQAITSGSTGGDSIRARIAILTKRLATHSATFSSLLSAYAEAGDAASLAVVELQDVSRTLVYEVNRTYSATNGEDLFKMTTKSSNAIHTLGVACRDIIAYGEFVDSLYFLVYEGSGNCKRLPSPTPDFAMDVKFLRANVRHDLDHGSEKDVANKVTRNAKVFQKYSGKKTPEECGPDEFMAIQLRILQALVQLLTSLKR